MSNKVNKCQVIGRSPKERYICYNDILGHGAYKIVYRGYDTHNGTEVAWNSIHIGGLSDYDINAITSEVKILEELSSQNMNIINFFNAWIDYDAMTVILITEIALSGTLYDYRKKIQHINIRVIKKWCVQILDCLKFLHSKNIAHRDLKLNNIFYNSNTGNIILGDFGLANKTETSFHSVIGTPEYMAPEMYEEAYDEKVDIWAFGMCIMELITQEAPYNGSPLGTIIRKVVAGELPDALNKIKNLKAKNIILRCLQKNPHDRPSAEELLGDEFFKSTGEEDNTDSLCLTPVITLVKTGKTEPVKKEVLSTHEQSCDVEDITINPESKKLIPVDTNDHSNSNKSLI